MTPRSGANAVQDELDGSPNMDRIDADDKATGTTRYVADIDLPGTCHVVFVRSHEPHARILGIDTAAALAAPGVVGVFTAAGISIGTYGRWTRDMPFSPRQGAFGRTTRRCCVAETRNEAEDGSRIGPGGLSALEGGLLSR